MTDNILAHISGTFSHIWDLCRNMANMNFYYRTNPIKMMMMNVMMMMMMMMMIMNCFCCMVDQRKAFSLVSSRDQCQRSSPSRISDSLLAGFWHVQNVSSGFVEWSCAVVITTTPRHHQIFLKIQKTLFLAHFPILGQKKSFTWVSSIMPKLTLLNKNFQNVKQSLH